MVIDNNVDIKLKVFLMRRDESALLPKNKFVLSFEILYIKPAMLHSGLFLRTKIRSYGYDWIFCDSK